MDDYNMYETIYGDYRNPELRRHLTDIFWKVIPDDLLYSVYNIILVKPNGLMFTTLDGDLYSWRLDYETMDPRYCQWTLTHVSYSEANGLPDEEAESCQE